MYGWAGRRLMVDLTSGEIVKQSLDEGLLHAYIGGRGLNSRTLYDLVKPGTDPLGPDNVLLFGAGPVNGTLIPGSGRYTVTALSPLTLIGDNSPCFGDANSGGFFGAEFKFAGYDQIVIRGQSRRPVYLWIDDDNVVIRPADDLWGKDTWETEKLIKDELGDKEVHVACIGPGGENLCRIACIINNLTRAAGRSGMGAVMGSKRLKAVVVRGTKGVKIAKPREMIELAQEAIEALHEDLGIVVWGTHGTASLLRQHQAMGRLTTRNFQRTEFEGWQGITAETVEQHWTAHRSCHACPIHCSHWYKVDSGPYKGVIGGGPEFAATGGFGSKCGNSDMASILAANTACNRLGLDVLSTSSAIAWTMECTQRGLADGEQTDGLDLTWGNHAAIVEIVPRIAHRRGAWADLLAEGAYRASKKLGKGSESYVIHSKGQDVCLPDARMIKTYGLGYAVASRGADHLRTLPPKENTFTTEEATALFGTPEATKLIVHEGKGRVVKWSEEHRALADSLETCKFVVRSELIHPRWLVRFLNVVTGLEIGDEEIMRAGERIVNVERAFNVRQGLTRRDDTISERFLKEPVPSGPGKGETCDLEPMLDEYYRVRGWDVETGFQGVEKLLELGLSDIAEELGALGRVAVGTK